MNRSIPLFLGWAATGYLMLQGLTGCESETLPEAPPPPQLEQAESLGAQKLKTFAYNCLINGYVVADFRQSDDSMWLFLPRETLLLPRERTASGARYSNGDISFWSKGTEALLEDTEGQDHCVEDRRASILEDAKLRGVDYRATGNEPGWVLEITGNAVMFSTNYGQDTYNFVSAGHAFDQDSRIASYNSVSTEPAISARIIGKTCSDDMSGERFETQAEVELNGSIYRGCGQGLH